MNDICFFRTVENEFKLLLFLKDRLLRQRHNILASFRKTLINLCDTASRPFSELRVRSSFCFVCKKAVLVCLSLKAGSLQLNPIKESPGSTEKPYPTVICY